MLGTFSPPHPGTLPSLSKPLTSLKHLLYPFSIRFTTASVAKNPFCTMVVYRAMLRMFTVMGTLKCSIDVSLLTGYLNECHWHNICFNLPNM